MSEEDQTDFSDLDAEDGAEEGQGEDPVTALQREVAELRTRNTQLDRQLQSGIGRLQSMMQKLESGRGDTDALKRQIETQMGAVTGSLEAILEDEAISPEVRARARRVAQEAKSASELAALKSELDSLKEGSGRPASSSTDISDFEESIVDMIKVADLDPDDAAFDWKGEATQVFREQGPGATRAYFRKKIDEAKSARQTEARRQTRKDTAGKGPAPEGTATRLFDPAKSKEERLKTLVEMGALSVG